MLSRLRTLSVAMRKALVPVMILLVANIVITQVTRPVGPFKRDGTDDDLRNMAYNFAIAMFFQLVLLVFLFVIAALVRLQRKNHSGLIESVVLGPALVALYLATVTCAIMLAVRPPNFAVLVFIGLAIMALAWMCLIVAVIRNVQAG